MKPIEEEGGLPRLLSIPLLWISPKQKDKGMRRRVRKCAAFMAIFTAVSLPS
jgi:hypothetical protein